MKNASSCLSSGICGTYDILTAANLGRTGVIAAVRLCCHSAALAPVDAFCGPASDIDPARLRQEHQCNDRSVQHDTQRCYNP